MKVISEISLRDFKFWSGGEDRAKNCTDEQLDKIESIMESDAPESGWTDDDINNFFGLTLIQSQTGLDIRTKNILMQVLEKMM